MEPFRVDFSMNRGHEMLLAREPHLTREELDEVDLHMLQAQRIPRLLAVDWLEVDGAITFRYDITGKKMISRTLQAQTISMADYYALLLGVAEALEECRHYLLREECCLLQENYIFVGDEWDDIRLAYVPLNAAAAAGRSAKEALLGLAVRWFARVSPVDGKGMQDVLQLLEDPAVSVRDVRGRLLEWIGRPLAAGGPEGRTGDGGAWREPHRKETPQAAADGRERGDERPRAHAHLQADAEFGSRPARRERPASYAAAEDALPQSPPETADDGNGLWPEEGTAGLTAARAKWISGAVAALALACCWRFGFAVAPGMNTLLISCGLSLLVAWGYLVALRRLRAGKDSDWEETDDGDDIDFASRWLTPGAVDRGTASPTADGGSDTEQFAQEAGEDETALLDAGGRRADGQQRGGWRISRSYAGDERRYQLESDETIIGRSAEAARIVDDAEGVSRAHVAYVLEAGKPRVRDLSSRNGSLLNGEPMVPYKSYELQAGDLVQLAGPNGPRYVLETEH